jgi:hypothetical protein
MMNYFNNSGYERKNKEKGLYENTYTKNKYIRERIHRSIAQGKLRDMTGWNRPEKFITMRMTRLKIDILVPVGITLIWLLFVIYSFMSMQD